MNTTAGPLFVIGLNHRTTPLEVRERFALSPERVAVLTNRLKERVGLLEIVVLNTCNRLEIYGLNYEKSVPVREIFEVLASVTHEGCQSVDFETAEPHLYAYGGEECVRHLFRVASSLDSLVVGETEIVGQVKKAYQQAQASGSTGKALNRLFQKALSVSKQVRTRSGIGRCSTSVGSVSLDLAEKLFGEDLSRQTILIIGAGKIGETTLRHLAKRGAKSILVANRSLDRAQELAGEFAGKALSLSDLSVGLAQADIVISSTSAPHYVLARADLLPLMEQRRDRPIFLIDLAVPRDIDPGVLDLDGVYLYNIDQLAEIARHNAQLRQAEAAACEEMVRVEAHSFDCRLTNPALARPDPTSLAEMMPDSLTFARLSHAPLA